MKVMAGYGYGRSRYARAAAPRVGRWMDLRFAGTCAGGGEALPAGSRAFYDPSDRSVCCTDLEHAELYGVTTEEWIGSPVSGGYVRVLSEYRTAGGKARTSPGRVVVARFAGGGVSYRNSNGRCEDAPCCGCCS